MNALQIAIYNKFNANTGHGAYTGVSGRFYLNVAPQGVTFPYVVYFEVTDIDDLNFTDELQEHLIQFNCFSQNNSALEAGQIFDNLKRLFDNCSLTVTDWRHIGFQRALTIPNNDFSQVPPIHGYSIQYDVLLERDKRYLNVEGDIGYLNFDAQTGSFTAGNTITGATSGATATIVEEIADVTVAITDVSGTFQDDEIIYESALGAELITAAADREFTSDTGFWTKGTGVDINVTTANKCYAGNVTQNAIILRKTSFVTSGNIYKVLHTVTGFVAGGTQVSLGVGSSGQNTSADGIYTDYILASDRTLGLDSRNAATTLDIDDLSVKQATNAALADGTIY